jgi:hypothetical protein
MIASPEAAKPRVFKLVLAPSIVNPRHNRLWLVPLDRTKAAVTTSLFDPISSIYSRRRATR